MQTLSVPLKDHGQIIVKVDIDMDSTSYGAQCVRHYIDTGPRWYSKKDAEKWKCPKCLKEERYFEKATRDD